ncbi:MAG: biotin--[acetyl-CoA-carboxylase] ligase, partial [Actinomycetota bacterium]|nr:biotin--[acetyl-CoA-carboxylase] ligase [Actinomycetota bacterium]
MLDEGVLRDALVGQVAGLDVVAVTGSTNADLLAAARAGAPDRTVLVAERQDRG